MTTRNGAAFNLNSSKTKTPTIVPRPTVQSVHSAVIELERKYTNFLSKCDEVLALKQRIIDIESENQRLCARMVEIEKENVSLKEQLSALKPANVEDVASKQSAGRPVPSVVFDIEGNVLTSIKNKNKRRDRNLSTSRLTTTKPNFVHSKPTERQTEKRNQSAPKRKRKSRSQPSVNNHSDGSQSHKTSAPNSPTKWKWFHLSSFVTLTSQVIRDYLSVKLKTNEVRCFSLTPTNSKTYKVGVPVEKAKQLYDMNFWPIGTYVRDFDVRKNFQQHPVTTVDR